MITNRISTDQSDSKQLKSSKAVDWDILHNEVTIPISHHYTSIANLKIFYDNRCQIRGACCFEDYNIIFSKSHHINPLCPLNNDSEEILILCPKYNRVLQVAKLEFY